MGSDEIVAALKKRRSAEVRLLCLEPSLSGLGFSGVSVFIGFWGRLYGSRVCRVVSFAAYAA